MNREAAKAIENAISFEAKKDGLQQRQDGSWNLRLTVASTDMNARITSAPMGTRYQMVLVEISDDETPVDHKAIERDKWRDLGPVKQAGIRCKDPEFWEYLTEDLHFPPILDEDMAATCIREQCQVESRGDLAKPGSQRAREIWYRIDFGFKAFKERKYGLQIKEGQ
jgi:hypothetical protein